MPPFTAPNSSNQKVVFILFSLYTVPSFRSSHDSTSAPAATGLKDLRTSGAYGISSPTLLFIRPDHLDSLTEAITQQASKSSWFLYNFAWRHKLAGILEGYITKQSLWDRLVFDGARMKVMGKGAGTVRAVIVSGGASPHLPNRLYPSRACIGR